MSNIPALTGKKIIKALKKAGFEVARIKGSHHFILHSDGRRTVIPIHGKETGFLMEKPRTWMGSRKNWFLKYWSFRNYGFVEMTEDTRSLQRVSPL